MALTIRVSNQAPGSSNLRNVVWESTTRATTARSISGSQRWWPIYRAT